MQSQKFTYRPKSQSVSYMEVCRPEGYRVRSYHMHDHEEIVLVDTKGLCRLVNNGNSLVYETPVILMHRAGTYHETEAILQGDYHSRVVFFHPQNLQNLPEELACRELFENDMLILPLEPEQLAQFQPLFDMLEQRPMAQKRLLMLCILNQMQALIRSGVKPVTTDVHHTYIFDVLETIQTKNGQVTGEELAQQWHVSHSKLKKDFKEVTGVSVAVFCRRVRLQQAQALLDTTDWEQARIARTCGFSDESYFIESFRKAYGITPGAYRRKG